MIRPSSLLETLRKAVEDATGPRWRPSSYISIPQQENTVWEAFRTRRGKSLVDAVVGSLIVLILGCFFWASGSTGAYGSYGSASRHAQGLEMFDILGDFNATGIRELCRHKRWQEGLFFRCDDHYGGVSNVRSSILMCTRYALESGAHLVLPQIATQDAEGQTELGEMAYFFDVELYRGRLLEACPQLTIYETAEDIAVEHALTVPHDTIDPLELHDHIGLLNHHQSTHRVDMRHWLWEHAGVIASTQTPVLLSLKRTLFGWPFELDSYEVWSNWGKLLPFQSQFYALASEILSLMADSAASSLQEPVIMTEAFKFVGQHMTIVSDVASDEKAFSLDEQINAGIKACQESGITHLYVATSTNEETREAIAKSNAAGITVHTKHSLIQNHAVLERAVAALTDEQKVIIDYLILLKSTKFVGVDVTSLSSTLVVTRHASLADATFWTGEPDGLSSLVGDRLRWLRDGAWP